MNTPRRLSGDPVVGGRLGLRGVGNNRGEEPVDAGVLIDEAWDLCEAGSYAEAFAKLERVPPAARKGPDYLIAMEMACGELKMHRRRLAVAKPLVAADPDVEIHWVILGYATLQVMGLRAAVRVWHRAIRHDPLFALVRLHLASHYCELERLRPAREQLKIALYLDPEIMAWAMDEPRLGPIWETIAEADPPPPEEGEEWKESGAFA